MRLALRLAPLRASDLGKPGIALVIAVDLSEHQPGGHRQGLGEQPVPPDHERERLPGAQSERSAQGGGDSGAGSLVASGAADDDVLPAGQRAAERLPGPPAHNHWVAESEALKMLQILRQVPRQLAVCADDAVRGDRGNEIDTRSASVYAAIQL